MCIRAIITAVVVAAATATAAVTYGVSGPEYQHVVPHGAITDYLIATLAVASGGPLGPHVILECTKQCILHHSCASYVVKPSNGLCLLSRLNRCIARKTILLAVEGHFYYEKFEAAKTLPSTCYASCLLDNNTCGDCGRPNCWGDQCQQCAATCWDRTDKTDNNTILLTNNKKSFHKVLCRDNWQRWWEGKGIAKSTPDEALLLRLYIVYADGRKISADFDSVVVENKGDLSVGNMTRDNGAGNWWEAPFAQRPLRSFTNSNCYRFYTPSDTCVSLTTMPVEKQRQLYNGTVPYRGYPWRTGDDSYDAVSIIKVVFWVKCAKCTEEAP